MHLRQRIGVLHAATSEGVRLEPDRCHRFAIRRLGRPQSSSGLDASIVSNERKLPPALTGCFARVDPLPDVQVPIGGLSLAGCVFRSGQGEPAGQIRSPRPHDAQVAGEPLHH